MITVELARALLAAGVLWEPRAGDRFVIDAELLTAEVFWISDLTVEVHTYRDQSLLGFNGTTEWALDSIEQAAALWVPAEHQLRERLGEAFAGLAPTGDGYRVTLRVDGATTGYEGPDPAEAYALALLHLLRSPHA